jgi:hypothetical protein
MKTFIILLLILGFYLPKKEVDKFINKVFVYELHENPEISDCNVLVGTDCGFGYLLFGENQEVIYSESCCCSSPSDYYKGIYEVRNDSVIVNLYATYVSEWHPDTKIKNDLDMEELARLKPVLIKGQKTTLRFKIKYCQQKKFYLEDRKNSIYATLAKDSYQAHLKKLKAQKELYRLLTNIQPD